MAVDLKVRPRAGQVFAGTLCNNVFDAGNQLVYVVNVSMKISLWIKIISNCVVAHSRVLYIIGVRKHLWFYVYNMVDELFRRHPLFIRAMSTLD